MAGAITMPVSFRYKDVFLKGRPQHEKFDGFWCRHPPMSPARWAKIFAPFDALKGFDELISSQEVPYADPSDKSQGDEKMCCRYYMEMSPELRPFIEAANRSPLKVRMINQLGKPLKTAGEIFPTDMVPVIAPNSRGTRTVFPMVWGYHVSGMSQPVVNARMETAPQKPLWQEGWKAHRCVIPASWYYEWEHLKRPDGKMKTGDKYLIQPKGLSITCLAGLYRLEESGDLKYPVFSILTRQPSPELLRIHDRMPLILPPDLIDDWINPEGKPDEIAGRALTEMIFEKTG